MQERPNLGNDLEEEDDYSPIEQLNHPPSEDSRTFEEAFTNAPSPSGSDKAPSFSFAGVKEYTKHEDAKLLVRDHGTDIYYIMDYHVVAAQLEIQFRDTPMKLDNIMSRIHQSLPVIIDHDNRRAFSPEMNANSGDVMGRMMSIKRIEQKLATQSQSERLQMKVEDMNKIYGLSRLMEI